MSNMNKILVAFDGSKDGLKALKVANKIATDNDAHLTVAYVHDSMIEEPVYVSSTASGDQFMMHQIVGPGVMQNTPASSEKRILEKELPNRVIAKAKHELKDVRSVKYKKIVGKPADELLDYAEANEINLIVIGSRGLSGLKKLVLGSVSQKVVNNAECSVFIVK